MRSDSIVIVGIFTKKVLKKNQIKSISYEFGVSSIPNVHLKLKFFLKDGLYEYNGMFFHKLLKIIQESNNDFSGLKRTDK